MRELAGISDEVTGERLAYEQFCLHIDLAAHYADMYTIAWLGDNDYGGIRNVIYKAFAARNMDVLLLDRQPQRRVALTITERQAVFDRDGQICRWCGATEQLTIDHIHPVSYGGTNAPENLQVLCRSCNSWKGNRRPEE